MGRKSDYDRLDHIKKDLNKEDLIKNALNHSPIGTKEMSIILGYSERSVSDMLKKLCEHSDLNIEDFREGKNYRFKPEWNGILTTLLSMMSLPGFDKRFAPHSVIEIYDKSSILLEGVDAYLSLEDQKIVKDSVCYKELQIDSNLYSILTKRFSSILSSLAILPKHLRTQTLVGFNKILEPVPSQLNERYVSYLMNEDLRKNRLKSREMEGETQLIENSVEELLSSMLKLRLKNQAFPEKPNPNKDIVETLLGKGLIDELTTAEMEGFDDLINKSREELLELKDLKEALNKVKNVLDANKPYENLVIQWIENLLLSFSLIFTSSSENQDIADEFLRQALTREALRSLIEE